MNEVLVTAVVKGNVVIIGEFNSMKEAYSAIDEEMEKRSGLGLDYQITNIQMTIFDNFS